ncbi:MAG: hypothetical protein IJV65_04610 [Kiritimatiellae bacterium]|nr:hypothetical protein [Kiritimatiellia bacterium]
MHDDSIVKVVFGAVWVAIALAGPLLDRAKKKKRRREEAVFREKAALDSLRPGARPRGDAGRPRVVVRPRPAPAAAPPPAPENLARYGMAEDSPALGGQSVAEVLRQLEERRAARRTALEREAAAKRAEAEAARARAAAEAATKRAAEEAAAREAEAKAAKAAAAAAAPDPLARLLAGAPGETRADALRRAVLLHEILGRRGGRPVPVP